MATIAYIVGLVVIAVLAYFIGNENGYQAAVSRFRSVKPVVSSSVSVTPPTPVQPAAKRARTAKSSKAKVSKTKKKKN